MPKDGMVIVDLATGKATRIDRVKRFQVAEKASAYLVYLQEGPDTPGGAAPKPDGGDRVAADQQAGRGGRGGGGAAGGAGRGPRPEFGTDMVVRSLSDGD